MESFAPNNIFLYWARNLAHPTKTPTTKKRQTTNNEQRPSNDYTSFSAATSLHLSQLLHPSMLAWWRMRKTSPPPQANPTHHPTQMWQLFPHVAPTVIVIARGGPPPRE
jgi:hypothetical protein